MRFNNLEDQYLKRRVGCIDVEEKSISQLLSEMIGTAFQSRKLRETVEVWEEMLRACN